MDGQKLALSIAVVILGLACFVLGTVALIIPQWGTFRTRVHGENGNFGPWTMCKDIGYGRQLCGTSVSIFKPSFAVKAAGICGAIGITALGLYCLTSIFQIAMQVTQSRILAKYYYAIIAKLLCSVIAALLTITAVCLFATQGDDLERGYIIEAGVSFYLEVILAIFTFILMLLTVVEFTIARRHRAAGEHNNTTVKGKRRNVHDSKRGPPHYHHHGGGGNQGLLQSGFGTTIGNPGFRDRPNGISMTDSSVRFMSSSSMSNKLPQSLHNNTNHKNNNKKTKQTSRLALARNLSANSQLRKQSKLSKNHISKNVSNSKSKTSTNFNSSDTNWDGSVTSIDPASNGSSISVISSMSTISTIASINQSTVNPLPRGQPLRSSLKKSKPPLDEFGIQNPGFNGTSSPTLSRSGSLKKVRIQTQSTDV